MAMLPRGNLPNMATTYSIYAEIFATKGAGSKRLLRLRKYHVHPASRASG
ncbi:MAG: hypothetical protein ACREB5_00460 [Sphingomonadaceae bacterium]